MAKKRKYNSEEFFQLLKQKTEASSLNSFLADLTLPIIFVSNDSLRIRRAISWIRETIPVLSSAEVISYFSSDLGSKNSVAPILQALKSPTLFLKEQIILIHNANKLKANILEELNLGSEVFSLLVLFAEELNASLDKIGTIVEFEEFSKAKIGRWIKKEFSELGFNQVDADAINFLAESFNGNLGELFADISRICLLSIDGQAVKLETAKKIVSHNAEASGFDLFSSISLGKVVEAQDKLNLMFKQGMHPLQVNAFLSRCYRTLAAKEAGASKELSNPWFKSKIKNYTRNYSPRYLAHLLVKLAELDFALKDSGVPHEDKVANAVLHFTLRS